MTYRIPTTADMLNYLEGQAPKAIHMLMDDMGYQAGDYIYYLHQEDGRLIGLVARKINAVRREGVTVDNCCVIEVQ